MIHSVKRLALGIGLASAAALGLLAASGLALADAPVDAAAVALTFEEPQVGEGGISVSVRLTTAEGEPITRQPVDFFVMPDFFGERPLPLRSALTNAQGRATVTYSPTWEGAHRLTARFGGDEAYQPVEVTSVLMVSGLPSTYTSEHASLSSVRQWAAPGAVAVAIAVWLVLAWVLIRVGWGVWQIGRRGEEPVPSPPAPAGDRAAAGQHLSLASHHRSAAGKGR